MALPLTKTEKGSGANGTAAYEIRTYGKAFCAGTINLTVTSRIWLQILMAANRGFSCQKNESP